MCALTWRLEARTTMALNWCHFGFCKHTVPIMVSFDQCGADDSHYVLQLKCHPKKTVCSSNRIDDLARWSSSTVDVCFDNHYYQFNHELIDSSLRTVRKIQTNQYDGEPPVFHGISQPWTPFQQQFMKSGQWRFVQMTQIDSQFAVVDKFAGLGQRTNRFSHFVIA